MVETALTTGLLGLAGILAAGALHQLYGALKLAASRPSTECLDWPLHAFGIDITPTGPSAR